MDHEHEGRDLETRGPLHSKVLNLGDLEHLLFTSSDWALEGLVVYHGYLYHASHLRPARSHVSSRDRPVKSGSIISPLQAYHLVEVVGLQILSRGPARGIL
jgi:hypothetical protein